MEFGFGLSEAQDLFEATREAARQARERLPGGSPQAALIVTAGEPVPMAGAIAREVLGPIPVAGGGSAGLLTDGGVAPRGVAVMCFRSEDWAIQSACAGSTALDPVRAVDRVTRLILSGRPNRRRYPRGVALAFGDSRAALGAGPLASRWREMMGPKLKTVGSLASDEGALYCGAVHDPGPLSVLCLEGPASVGVGVGLGWTPLSLTCAVTRADGCLVHELDGRSAAQVYREALPGSVEDPIRFPLGLVAAEDQWLIRCVLGIEGTSLRLGGTIPPGANVRLMAASTNGLHQASRDAIVTAVKRLEGRPARALLVVESAARWGVQNGMARREWETVREQAAGETPCLGWLTDLELVTGGDGHAALQNGSVIVVALP